MRLPTITNDDGCKLFSLKCLCVFADEDKQTDRRTDDIVNA